MLRAFLGIMSGMSRVTWYRGVYRINGKSVKKDTGRM